MENNNDQDVQAPNLEGEAMKMPTGAGAATPQSESTTPLNGIIITIMIVLLLFILGGLYLWFSQLMLQDTQSPVAPIIERPTQEENNEPESTTAEAAVETQQAVSTSDEIAAIEADIEATDLDALDAELNAIDAELDAALNEAF